MIDFIVFLFFTFSGLIPVDNSTTYVYPNGTTFTKEDLYKDEDFCMSSEIFHVLKYNAPLICYSA